MISKSKSQSRIENGHNADENHVSKTSLSLVRTIFLFQVCSTANIFALSSFSAQNKFHSLSYQTGI
ncbi:MAG: hypothetical protein U9Q66_01325 [Patescibacteria group bacterium]|nr:hypothetical protein [Patescibacteria group bacterium]